MYSFLELLGTQASIDLFDHAAVDVAEDVGDRRRVFVYREAVDMRKAYDSLSALVTGNLKMTITSGNVFVFIGKTRRRAKALYFDGTGLCLFCKRLVTGHFVAPWTRPGSGPIELTMSELTLLIEGSELVMRARLSPEAYVPRVAASASA